MNRVVAASLGLLIAFDAAAADRTASTLDGVFTEAQAARGVRVYEQNCAICHGADLTGSFDVPNLRGYFIAAWTGTSLDLLYDYVSSAMPVYAPGTLSPDAYADVIAYMLKSNGLPAASQNLPTDPDALRRIILGGPARYN